MIVLAVIQINALRVNYGIISIFLYSFLGSSKESYSKSSSHCYILKIKLDLGCISVVIQTTTWIAIVPTYKNGDGNIKIS